jgi:hypothetical protein
MRLATRRRNGRRVLDHAPARKSGRRRAAPSACASTLRSLACSRIGYGASLDAPCGPTSWPVRRAALQLLVEACVLALQLGDPALHLASRHPQLPTLGTPCAGRTPGNAQKQRKQQAHPGGQQQQVALGEASDRLAENGHRAWSRIPTPSPRCSRWSNARPWAARLHPAVGRQGTVHSLPHRHPVGGRDLGFPAGRVGRRSNPFPATSSKRYAWPGGLSSSVVGRWDSAGHDG